MFKRTSKSHASKLAISLGLAAVAANLGGVAFAQTTTTTTTAPTATTPTAPQTTPAAAPPASAATTTDKVTITGSFIAGTPETAAIPVQVMTLEDLQNLGSPTNLDLVKNMTAVGGLVAGEQNRYNTFPLNYSSVNLRGLGASRTIVLFNGHRFAEQFSYGAAAGRSTNVNQIPMAAIARVETVTDGGSTTYGADAVGGVVNYITRHDFDGLEVSANYRAIENSDGDYGLTALWGHNFDNGNVMVAAEYNKRNILRSRDRDFGHTSYLNNPASATAPGWSSSSNPGAYTAYLTNTSTSTAITPAAGYSATSNYQIGSTGVFRDPACTNLGGFAGWSLTASPVCFMSLDASFDRLVEDTSSTNLYAEVNFDLSDKLRFHAEGSWYNSFTAGAAHPSDANAGGGFPPTSTTNGAGWASATYNTTSTQFSVPGANPAVADLLANVRNSDGSTAFTSGQIASIVSGGKIVLSAWRPSFANGNPRGGEDSYHRIANNLFRISGGFSGEFDPMFGFDVRWDTAITYARTLYKQRTEDIRTDRLFNALNGYGGPNCKTSATVPLLVAGKNGCEWFNPFSSAIAENIFTGAQNQAAPAAGLPNPNGYTYNPALANSTALWKWMWQPLWNDRTFDQFSYDLVFNADTPWELPGGKVQVAAGMQYRFNRQDDRLDDFSNRAITLNPCTLPTGANPAGTPQAMAGCTAANVLGDLYGSRPSTVFGPNLESTRRFPVLAFFYEANFPILDNWSVATSGRQETFYADLVDTETTTFVPQIQSKFEFTDWLAIRGTASKSFSYVQQPVNDGSSDALSSADLTNLQGANFGIGGTTSPRFNTSNFDNTDVKPEKGDNFNVGLLFRADSGKFNASIDYYDIKINDYLRSITTSNIVSALVMPGQTAGPTNLINCSSPLLTDNNPLFGGRPSVELNGPCVQGTSTLTSASGGLASATAAQQGRINYFGATKQFNGGSYHTTGLDMSASYRMDELLFGGDVTASVNATKTLTNGLDDFLFQGTKIANGFDGVGYLNLSTANGSIGPVPEWKATAGFNWRKDIHNLNLNVRYTSPLRNDVSGNFTENSGNNTNIGVNGIVTCAPDTNPVYAGDPAGAGSGIYGAAVVGGARGYCADQNLRNYEGFSIPPTFNVDLVYRVELPWQSTLALSVFNLLDADPEFSRTKFSYDTSTGNPLGRNFKVEFKKKF